MIIQMKATKQSFSYTLTTPKKAVQQNVSKQCPCPFIGIIGFWMHDAVVNIHVLASLPTRKHEISAVLFSFLMFYSIHTLTGLQAH